MSEEDAVLQEIDNLVTQGVLGPPKYHESSYFPYTAWPVLDLDLLPEWIESNYISHGEIRYHEIGS